MFLEYYMVSLFSKKSLGIDLTNRCSAMSGRPRSLEPVGNCKLAICVVQHLTRDTS